MLKLTKYEFRKNLTSTIFVLLILAAAEIYFLVSCAFDNSTHAAIAAMLLVILTVISFIIVIVFGINAYDKELRSKSSYLIFMTPNSSLKIILSKILYTLLFGVALAVILIGFSYIDFKVLSSVAGNPLSYIDLIKNLLTSMDIGYMSIVYGAISAIASILISLLFTITLAYFSITLASTLLQNKKMKGFVSVVLFIIISIIVGLISNKLPVIYPNAQTTFQAIVTVLPSTIFELVICAACIGGSAVLLDKKVSL